LPLAVSLFVDQELDGLGVGDAGDYEADAVGAGSLADDIAEVQRRV